MASEGVPVTGPEASAAPLPLTEQLRENLTAFLASRPSRSETCYASNEYLASTRQSDWVCLLPEDTEAVQPLWVPVSRRVARRWRDRALGLVDDRGSASAGEDAQAPCFVVGRGMNTEYKHLA